MIEAEKFLIVGVVYFALNATVFALNATVAALADTPRSWVSPMGCRCQQLLSIPSWLGRLAEQHWISFRAGKSN